MEFPKTLDELKARGYAFKDYAECRGCGDDIEWWTTPNQKNIPMNPMQRGSDEAVAHWSTCPDRDMFRKQI
jgi:hypothetical protein